MRRNRLPGTRNPFNEPLSKQRIMVCWLTLQILAASPVVNTVFVDMARTILPYRWSDQRGPEHRRSKPQTSVCCHVDAGPKLPETWKLRDKRSPHTLLALRSC